MLHGKFLPATVKASLLGPVHLVKASEVMVPMPVPDSPVPGLKVPADFVCPQPSDLPLVVSISVNVPDMTPVQDPPGETVQVEAVDANDAVVPRLIASADAAAVMKTARIR